MTLLGAFLFAAIELLAPRNGGKVEILPASQRAVLAQPTQDERLSVAASEAGPWRVPAPLGVTWRATDGVTGPWKIRLATDAEMRDGRDFYVTERELAPDWNGVCRYVLPRPSLEPGRRYWWRVWGNVRCKDWYCGSAMGPKGCACGATGPAPASQIWSFTTADSVPRWIEIEGRTRNMRDLGGWHTSDGRRVRIGMAFRGEAFNDDSVNGDAPGANRLTMSDVKYLANDLGIKTDLDLRTEFETAGMKESPLGAGVKFVHRSSRAYKEIFIPEGMKTMAENFRLFCDRANYPIFFHCIGGADRTGSLAYVLNGVLGVAKEDLERDWESTFYPCVPNVVENITGKPFSDGTYWRSSRHFDDGFAKYARSGDTLKDRIVAYLLDCGVTLEEISRFRSIMLE